MISFEHLRYLTELCGNQMSIVNSCLIYTLLETNIYCLRVLRNFHWTKYVTNSPDCLNYSLFACCENRYPLDVDAMFAKPRLAEKAQA